MRSWSMLFLGLLFVSGRAWAQDADDLDAARIHFQAGSEHYARGKYQESILEFKEAYRLSKKAALLYNVSQAYEKMGDYPRARDSLRQYMDSGQTEPGELPALRDKLRSLDARIAHGAGLAQPAGPAAAGGGEERRPFKTWRWVASGAGAALVGASIFFLVDGQAANGELQDAAGQNPLATYDATLQSAYDRGRLDNTLAIAFGVSGAILVATGVTLFVLDHKAARREILVPTASRSGFGVAAFWTF